MPTPNEFQRAVYDNSVDHGFWAPEHDNLYEKLALVHSEISEALECLRTGVPASHVWYRTSDGKPEGFGYELADAMIRILDIAEHTGLNLWYLMQSKHEFNTGRPYMHGKQA